MITILLLILSISNFKVSKINIIGNNYIKEKKIKQVMLTRTPVLFRKGIFNKTIFDGDIESIKALYRYNGFLEADIEYKLDFDSIKNEVKIAIDIKEGEQTTVKEIDFKGNRIFPGDSLRTRLTLKNGAPFDERMIEADIYIIISLYDEKGYTDITVVPDKKIDSHQAYITYKIVEGKRQYIEEIKFTGLRLTAEQIVHHQSGLRTGGLFRYVDLLSAEQRLYDLGIFNSIRTRVYQGSGANQKILEFNLNEKEPKIINFRIGYGTRDYLRAGLGFTHLNMFGRAWQGMIDTKLSFAEFRLGSAIMFPNFLWHRLRNKFGTFFQWKKGIGYWTRSIGGYDEIGVSFLKTQGTIRYDLNNVRTHFSASDSVTNDWVQGLRLNLLQDKRDDPFNPRTGTYLNIIVETNGIFMPGDVNLVKGIIRLCGFKPYHQLVGATSIKLGAVQEISPSTEVPVYKRFYCGGTSSVRGYSEGEIGSLDAEGNPSGGKVLTEISGEMRFPIYKFLGGVLFIDAGNVWLDYGEIDFSLILSGGAGLRLKTPLGSVRLDYGLKLSPQNRESPGKWHFAIGEAF